MVISTLFCNFSKIFHNSIQLGFLFCFRYLDGMCTFFLNDIIYFCTSASVVCHAAKSYDIFHSLEAVFTGGYIDVVLYEIIGYFLRTLS